MARKRKGRKRKLAHHIKKHAIPIVTTFIAWLLPSPIKG